MNILNVTVNTLYIPAGNGAYDLAQLAFMTSKLSEITTEPSAAIPQKSLISSFAPYTKQINKSHKQMNSELKFYICFLLEFVEDFYQCSKDCSGLVIIDNKSKASIQFFEDLISGIWAPVTEGPICLNHKHGLICALW